ncbi:MAG: hypothetical protein JSV86_06240 [Gemmatimonadota bacterium]|nr:MAG: hypothetical protein JSV86_06240 [Gemmatimonadota bacterium]
MLVNILLLIGAVNAVIFVWLLLMWAQQPIDGVNEPGLYRKLKEDKRK